MKLRHDFVEVFYRNHVGWNFFLAYGELEIRRRADNHCKRNVSRKRGGPIVMFVLIVILAKSFGGGTLLFWHARGDCRPLWRKQSKTSFGIESRGPQRAHGLKKLRACFDADF